MPWSWRLARIAGIDVDVHATFFMMIAWIALIGLVLILIAGGLTLGYSLQVTGVDWPEALTTSRRALKVARQVDDPHARLTRAIGPPTS